MVLLKKLVGIIKEVGEIDMNLSDDYQMLVDVINTSKYITALTGAGISTEAGIPDFRSPNVGLWARIDPMVAFTRDGFNRNPKVFYEVSAELVPQIISAEPTKAHKMLAVLEEMGKVKTVITQNIDGLHQKAGSRDVIEVHGNLREGTCTTCEEKYSMEIIVNKFTSGQNPPRCDKDEGVIKPDVVLFGDPLPAEDFARAVKLARTCDTMIVLGSSLVVYPVADLPRIALQSGARLIILNRDSTPYDSMATLVINESLGVIADQVMSRLQGGV